MTQGELFPERCRKHFSLVYSPAQMIYLDDIFSSGKVPDDVLKMVNWGFEIRHVYLSEKEIKALIRKHNPPY